MVVGPRRVLRVQSLRHDLGDVAGEVLGDVLGQAGDAQALLADDLAFVGGELPLEQAEQGAFALAVASEQADALASLDLKLDAVEQSGPSEGQAHIPQAQQCHG